MAKKATTKSKAKYMSTSYIDRMSDESFRITEKVKCKPIFQLSKVSEYDERLKRVVKRSKFVQVDHKKLSHLTVSDFSLSNLLAINAPLQPSPLMKHDVNTMDAIVQSQAVKIVESSKPE